MNTLIIIPARSKSKRIKNKNIIKFFGKEMIFHTIDELKKIKLKKKYIHVSTESAKIRNILKKRNFFISHLREKKLANDNTSTKDVLIFEIKKLEKKFNIRFDIVISVSACNPLFCANDLRKGIAIFVKNNFKNPVLSVSKYNGTIERAFKIKRGKLNYINSKNIYKRSQDFSDSYYDNDTFLITNLSLLTKGKKKYLPTIIPSYRSIDINYKEDLFFAKKLYKIKIFINLLKFLSIFFLYL